MVIDSVVEICNLQFYLEKSNVICDINFWILLFFLEGNDFKYRNYKSVKSKSCLFLWQSLVACKLYKSMAHEADEDNLEVDISEQFLNDGKWVDPKYLTQKFIESWIIIAILSYVGRKMPMSGQLLYFKE